MLEIILFNDAKDKVTFTTSVNGERGELIRNLSKAVDLAVRNTAVVLMDLYPASDDAPLQRCIPFSTVEKEMCALVQEMLGEFYKEYNFKWFTYDYLN